MASATPGAGTRLGRLQQTCQLAGGRHQGQAEGSGLGTGPSPPSAAALLLNTNVGLAPRCALA
jgi:hypothetical protein